MKPCSMEKNRSACNCTYPCSRKGLCCECVAYHRAADELPACYFSREAEKTYDRSVAFYIKSRGR